MAYSFLKQNDIFISYAHDDDIEGWVKHFSKLLARKLNKQLKVLEAGKNVDVTVWKDASLLPSGSLQNRLEETIMDSALFLVIMSESYLVSEWCRNEGEMFVNHLTGNRDLTIFIAEKEKTDRTRWPSYLRDGHGNPLLSKLFYVEKEVGIFQSIPIRDPTGEFNAEAGNAMDDFCVPICDALQNQQSRPSNSSCTPLKRVFLALCSQPDGEASKRLNELREKLTTLPDIEILPPLDPLNFVNSLSKRLAACDLFVQILDDKKGYYLSDRETGFVGHQFEEAREKGLPILQWKIPGLAQDAETDDPYHHLLNSLRPLGDENGTLAGDDFPDAMIAAIQSVLTERQPSALAIQTIRVEIRSLLEDRKEAIKVGEALKDRCKVWLKDKTKKRICVRPIVLYDGAGASDQDLLAKLSKGTVIIYARNPKWVDYHEDKVSSEDGRIGRIALCDPWPKEAEFLALRQLEMFSEANPTERDQEIDEFLKELTGALSTDG